MPIVPDGQSRRPRPEAAAPLPDVKTLNIAKNRGRKAAQLAMAAHDRDITPSQLATAGTARAGLVAATGVNEPSPETWAITIGILETLVRANPPCRDCGGFEQHRSGCSVNASRTVEGSVRHG